MPGGDITDTKQGHGMFFADSKAWEKEVMKYLYDCIPLGKDCGWGEE